MKVNKPIALSAGSPAEVLKYEVPRNHCETSNDVIITVKCKVGHLPLLAQKEFSHHFLGRPTSVRLTGLYGKIL